MVAAMHHVSADGALGRKPPTSMPGCRLAETPTHSAGVTPLAIMHLLSPGSLGFSSLSSLSCFRASPPPDNTPKGRVEN